MRVKQMIKSHIRVEEALAAHRSSTQVHKGGISDESPNKNHSPVRRQKAKKKGPFREPPNKPERVYTHVNASYKEIYMTLRGQNLLQCPPFLKPNLSLKFFKKFCQFHREKGHDTENCYALKKEVERLLAQGYLKQCLKKDPSLEGEGDEARQQRPMLPEVLVILGGLINQCGCCQQ
jgi:hypothetical protein